ncbi:MAG: prenyltransferase/squalene oxidase repeat-containing protein [Limisphaerales bacterium]
MLRTALLFAVAFIASGFNTAGAAASGPGTEAIRAAVEKSLPLLTAGARGSMEKRERCFTCHNQGLPVMALATAQSRGFKIYAEELAKQLKFTADFLDKSRTNYVAGKGQGGQVDTAGYALWALENGGWKPDATTAAVTEYLLRWQKELEHWKPQSRRPPTEQSLFTSTHAALRGLKTFGTPEQRERIGQRTEQVRAWLVKTKAEDTEDRVFRLRALHVAGAPEADVRQAAKELLDTQRADGGWEQLAGMETDSYATSTALVALHQAGGLATTEEAYRKGLRYLLGKQLPDGSWLVTSRSKPIQSYFESGYPHGTNQFISISAASWATTALALSLPATQQPLRGAAK